MITSLGWDTLEQRRLLNQSCMFCKIHQGYVDMNLPHEVHPIVRKSRLPNYQPFRQISCNNDIFKFSFYPRTIVTWNNLPFDALPASIDAFKATALSAIRSFV